MKMREFGWLAAAVLVAGMAACDDGTVGNQVDGGGNPQTDTIEPDATGNLDATRVDGQTCAPGTSQCVGTNFLECNDTGSDWNVTICDRGTSCTTSGCIETVCAPNSVSCNDDAQMIVCKSDGSGYGNPVDCPEGYECQAGQCLSSICTPGTKECAQTSILACEGEPPSWVEIPCADNEICFMGDCVDCFTDAQCTSPMVCTDGHCAKAPLAITTEELPVGQIEAAYSMAFEATGGTPPYAWSVASGALPTGLSLAADGTLAGTPTAQGEYTVTVAVQDNDGFSVQAEFALTILGKGLAITSTSPISDGEEGTEYSYTFKAIGGTQPYGWNVRAGALPTGLTMSSDGVVSGIPAAHGTFDFTVRVVDDAEPVQSVSKDFQMTVKIAPLEIIGDQVYDLWVTKIVILPLITIVDPIPVPYSTQLEAKGGVKPYTWSETELSGLLKTFIPKAGIPQGLTLTSGGKLSGAVTDSSLVFELNIPLMNLPTLKGFFFMGQVVDSQDPADSDQAIFLIPTVAVDLGL